MGFIDLFTWLVLLIMIASLLAVFVFLGMWPGIVARQYNHPQTEAIRIGSWITLLTGFVLWPVVLIWAYARPGGHKVADSQAGVLTDEHCRKLAALEARIARLESDRQTNQGGVQ